MAKINVGNSIRLKDRTDWPVPPGYRLAKSEGEVLSVDEELGFVVIQLLKSDNAKLIGNTMTFRIENVERI